MDQQRDDGFQTALVVKANLLTVNGLEGGEVRVMQAQYDIAGLVCFFYHFVTQSVLDLMGRRHLVKSAKNSGLRIA